MNIPSKTAVTAIFILAAAGFVANAGTITFSGYNWTTFASTGNESSGINLQNTYTTPDANTGVIGARYNSGGDNNMYTTLSLVAGDTVSYDYYLSNNNPGYGPGANGGTYYGDWTSIFSVSASDFSSASWATARTYSNNGNNHTGLSIDSGNSYFQITGGLETGVHLVYTFGATSYSVTATSIANPAQTMTYSANYLNGATATSIQAFRVGLWDSEQTATLANFAVTQVPEPGSMALIGLGCAGLFLVRSRRA